MLEYVLDLHTKRAERQESEGCATIPQQTFLYVKSAPKQNQEDLGRTEYM